MSRESVSSSTKSHASISVHKPRIYHVILLNDDFTPMDFVVAVLIEVFHHDPVTAEQIMWRVHNFGRAVAGTYPHDIAQTRQLQVNEIAFANQYPLRCGLEAA